MTGPAGSREDGAMQRTRGFSLIEILVVLVILGILMAVLLPRLAGGGRRPDGKPVESPIQRAHSAECMNNLSQLRQAYQMALTTNDEDRPTSTAALKSYGITDSMLRCPVGGQEYVLDPVAGRIACPQPGHESY